VQKRDLLIEIATRLGVKDKVFVPEGLFGYGKVKYEEEECIGCKRCEEACREGAVKFQKIFDLPKIFKESSGGKKGRILTLIRKLAQNTPSNPVAVPELVEGWGRVEIDFEKCIGCGNCERYCPQGAIKIENWIEVK
jgi:NAD-dependent dihydropyrimidine dehydrogenase PreA subunit